MTIPYTPRKDLLPPLALFILSPVIAEIIIGSTPVSHLPYFLLSVPLYGSGALLIREITRSLRLGWLSIFTLGLAFGIIEEGLALQSFFNPNSFGLDISFGRKFGVNWVWALFITVFHAFWSILIPIQLTEAMFPAKKNVPWLNSRALLIVLGIYLFMVPCYHQLFFRLTAFMAPLFHYFSVFTIALLLIVTSLKLPGQLTGLRAWRPPQPPWPGLISFFTVVVWFGGFTTIFIEQSFLSPVFALLICLCSVAFLSTFTMRWSRSDHWTPLHSSSVVLGAMAGEILYGALVLSDSDNLLNRLSQAILSVVLVLAMLHLTRKLKSHGNPQ